MARGSANSRNSASDNMPHAMKFEYMIEHRSVDLGSGFETRMKEVASVGRCVVMGCIIPGKGCIWVSKVPSALHFNATPHNNTTQLSCVLLVTALIRTLLKACR